MNKKRFFVIVVVIILIVILSFSVNCIYKTFIKEPVVIDDVNVYLTGQFDGMRDGKNAKSFLPNAEGVIGKITGFSYTDNIEKNNLFHKYCCSYVLDITYSDEEYHNAKKLISHSEEKENFLNEYYVLYEEIADENIKLILSNDTKNEIRYVYLLGECITTESIPSSLVMWNTVCDW